MDELIYKIPVIGKRFRSLYAFFKKNIAFADFIHIILGIGIGFLLANKWVLVGIFFIFISVMGHIYAYIKGRKLINEE